MNLTLNLNVRSPFLPYVNRTARWSTLVVHRRAGKTFVCIQDLLRRALTHKRPGPPLRYGYIAPTRDQGKDVAWNYLKKYVSKIPGSSANEAELSVHLPNKSRIRIYSGDSYERMRGIFFDGVVVDEAADIDPRAWKTVIRPALSDYSGWATFIGTPKGRNSFYDLYEKARKNESGNWYSLLLRASESGILSAAELADMQAEGTPEEYAQEMECDFSVALIGAIYARAVEIMRARGDICRIPADGSLPVWTVWDLGAPANTAVWTVQFLRGEIRLLHCDAGVNWSTPERVAAMLGRGYSYAGHIIPHDGQAIQKSGITYQDELERAGLRNVITLPRAKDGNARINRLLGLFPSMRMDAAKCEYGLKALENAAYRFDAKKKTYSDDPTHDWTSHPCDALGYLVEAMDQGIIANPNSRPRKAIRIISPI